MICMGGTKWLILCGVAAGALITLAQVSRPSPAPSSTTTPTTIPTTQPLPTAQQVIDRFIEVTGGREAYASITSRHLEADYEMADLGVTGKVMSDIRSDGNARQTITIPDLDSFAEGITGDVAWSMSQTAGPRILRDLEAQSLRQALSFSPELSLDAYKSAVVDGLVDVNGAPCYRMVLTLKAIDNIETRYYEAKSGYLIRRDGFVVTGEGPIAISTRYGEYEDAPPIRIAMKVRQSMSGLSPEQIVTKVQHNVAMPDELFALPHEVDEAIKQRATTQNTR